MKLAALLLALLLSTQAQAHGLSPQRLVVDSGTKTVVAQFTAFNNYKQQDRFSVECFKGSIDTRYPCQAIPQMFILSHNAKRKFKVRFDTEGDDVYLVCTIEEPEPDESKSIISRVCARIGVGADPTPQPGTGKRAKRRPTTNAVATRPGQDTVR